MQMIFVNLPVSDLTRTRKFYEGLGYEVNEEFSGDTNICVVVEENIFLMMMLKDRFAGFSALPIADPERVTGVLNAFSAKSREAVDEMAQKALAFGGRDNDKTQDHGYMYARSVSDPDGHVLEYVWMDMAGFDAAEG